MSPVHPHPQATSRPPSEGGGLTFRSLSLWPIALTLMGVAVLGAAPFTARLTAGVDRTNIEERTGQFFSRAVLVKPRPEWAATNLAFMLAPLLVEELCGTNPPVAVSPREMFFTESELSRNGIRHRQFTYLWFTNTIADRQLSTPAQGLRITLNARAEPVIWELWPDATNTRVIFVSHGLELLAANQYGPALPGRRFAVEQSLATAPTVVVARVIEDGPAVMGPAVYIRAGSGEITTLLCRCMPPQAREIVATDNYELRPMSESPLAAGVWPRRWSPAADLPEYLRLPLDF